MLSTLLVTVSFGLRSTTATGSSSSRQHRTLSTVNRTICLAIPRSQTRERVWRCSTTRRCRLSVSATVGEGTRTDNFQMYAAIPGSKVSTDAGGWIFPSNASLPTIQVDIGGQKFTINPKDHVFADAGNGMSFGGMQSRGNLTFNIYGDTFLKSIYAIFDVVSQGLYAHGPPEPRTCRSSC